MKKYVWIVFLLVMSIAVVGVCAGFREEKTITDVTTEQAAMELLSDKGLVQGYPDGELHAEASLTRAQAVVLILRASGFEDDRWFREDVPLFSDVPRAHWASGYVYYGVHTHVLNGMGDGTFAPESEVSLAQMVKMLICLVDKDEENFVYPHDYINEAQRLGLLKDISCKTDEIINRGQAALLLTRAMTIEFEDGKTLNDRYAASKGIVEEKETPENGFPFEKTAPEAMMEGAGGGSASFDYAEYDTTFSDSAVLTEDVMVETPVAMEPKSDIYIDDSQEIISAGTLTAGEIDDLRNFLEWQILMTDRPISELVEAWGIDTNPYVVYVSNKGKPVLGAKVMLTYDIVAPGGGGSQAIAYQAVTDRNGYAYVFTGNAIEQQMQTLQLTVETEADCVVYENVALSADEPFSVEVESTEPEDILDLMFVIDTTGSMGDELRYIQVELKDVIERIDADVRISCNYYRDEGDEYVVRDFPFTTNVDTVIQQLAVQRAVGGGDYEEAVDAALINAIDAHDWSPSAKERLLFLVLDAPPHPEAQLNIRDAVRGAAAKGIRIIPIASSGIDKNTEMLLRSMSIATNGTYLFLTDDSGVGNPHLKPSAEQYEVDTLNEMILKVINRYLGLE